MWQDGNYLFHGRCFPSCPQSYTAEVRRATCSAPHTHIASSVHFAILSIATAAAAAIFSPADTTILTPRHRCVCASIA